MMSASNLRPQIEDFLIHEAWLLDQGRFEDWLDLLTDDVRYWAPVRREMERGKEDFTAPNLLAHYDDNKFGLTLRVQRIRSGFAHADEPPARVRHLISNVKILGEEDDLLQVTSNFICFKSRLGDEIFYVGSRNDSLRRVDGDWKIARRCIILDHSVLDGITTFF